MVMWRPVVNRAGIFGVVLTITAVLAVVLVRAATQRSAGSHENAGVAPTPRSNPVAIRFPRNTVEFERLFEEIENWGRWGPDDQLGAINLITEDKRKEAFALARLARQVSLARPFLTQSSPGVTAGTFDGNGTPFEQTMGSDFTTDTYKVTYHSFLHSHLDALCHFPYKGKDYNGYPASATNTSHGCTRLGVENLRNGIITRGILIDMPRLRNVPYLEPGTPVFIEDIEAWEKTAGVQVSSGDAVFLRTGRWARWEKAGPWNLSQKEAGFHPSVAQWLKQRDVSVVGSDVGLDVTPSPVDGVPDMPLHVLTINALGIIILDNHDLEALADTAAELHRWEFMVFIAPLVVTGGTGSPVNSIAIF
jgi:kynurenine formamidase